MNQQVNLCISVLCLAELFKGWQLLCHCPLLIYMTSPMCVCALQCECEWKLQYCYQNQIDELCWIIIDSCFVDLNQQEDFLPLLYSCSLCGVIIVGLKRELHFCNNKVQIKNIMKLEGWCAMERMWKHS